MPEHVKENVEWMQKKWNFQVDAGREPSRLHLCQHCVKHRWSCQWCAFCVNEWQSEYTVMDRVWDGCGSRRSMGKRAEADRKQIGRASERTGSRKDLVSTCALHPRAHSVLFQKADQTEKETGGTEVDIQTGDTGGNI